LEVGRTIDQGGGGGIRWAPQAHGYEKNGGIRPPVGFFAPPRWRNLRLILDRPGVQCSM